MKNDLFLKINELVIEGLKAEGLQWFKPWKSGSENQPFNLATNRYYNGFNIFMLNCVMRANGYEYNQWLTFKQISAKGGKVIKGSKSTEVYLWSIGYWDNKLKKFVAPKLVKNINPSEKLDGGSDRYRKTFSVRFYKVFNVAQTEGIEPKKIVQVVVENDPIKIADDVVVAYCKKQSPFNLQHSNEGAYYNSNLDFVNMPRLDTFVDSDSYYKVLFHELAHSTGHKSRLNRKTLIEVVKWGDNTYAKEELVAEISSMYMVGLLGLNPTENVENSQAYIKGWCKHLTDKPKECVYTMQSATKVVDYLLSK